MLDMIVERSVEALQAEQGAIKLLTDEEASPLQTLIQIDQHTQLVDIHVGMHITGWVIRNEESLLIEDLKSDDRFDITPQEADSIKNLLCVPIFFRGELLGIIMVVNKKSPAPFDLRDQRMLSIIAAQSGQLIHNRYLQQEAVEKERIQQELELARQIQLNLIPKTVPQVQNLEVAGYIQAADEVGGDYFDYFQFDENRLGVVMADVSGHGPSAALIMTMVKGILHSIAAKGNSPQDVLSELNTVLSEIAPPEIFVTMAFLIFDGKNRRLHYANAGHNPLVHFQVADSSTDYIKFYSPSLNISPMATFTVMEIPLNAGDFIFVYTDGVTESFNEDGEMFSEASLLAEVKNGASGSSAALLQHIRNALQTFCGKAPQHDDIAMIAIKID